MRQRSPEPFAPFGPTLSSGGGDDVALFAATVRRVQQAYGDACFACGQANPSGLHLEPMGWDDDWVRAQFQPRPDHVGAPPTMHGGIAATALDEIMVWAGIMAEGVMTVTGTLDVRYRSPLRIDHEVIAHGRVVDRSGRRLRTEGRLEVGDRIAAEAQGLYIVIDDVSSIVGNNAAAT